MSKKAEMETNQPKGYVHVDVFLDTATDFFGLDPFQVKGFKAYMTGQYYKKTDQDFIPYLEEYLGRKLKV